MSSRFDYAIIGGGIVGLSTAWALARRNRGASVVVLEKEDRLAAHQTGRNSGVIHSGIYYKPGSLKARFARAGAQATVAFCREHDLPHEICGKVIVATDPAEIPRMEALHERALANGVKSEVLDADGLREKEPHVTGIAGLWIPEAGITDYGAVARRIAELLREAGGEVRTGVEVLGSEPAGDGWRLATPEGPVEAGFVANCGGLYSDRIARRAGAEPGIRIVPFRGEYYELAPARHDLVRGLIYPVPDPELPFLGVHLTKMIHGGVHAGPNAVLAFRREGYRKRDFHIGELAEVLRYRGFWRLAWKYPGVAARELFRSYSKAAFTRSLRRLVPDIRADDLVPSPAGVRAQALHPDGTLVHDFLLVPGRSMLHVCNAPSPAATASLPIGEHIAEAAERVSAGKEMMRT